MEPTFPGAPKLQDNTGPNLQLPQAKQINTLQLEEVDNLIQRRVAEAKLEIAESRMKRLEFLAGGALALIGIIIPVVLAVFSYINVGSSVQEMKSDVRSFSDSQASLANSASNRADREIERTREEVKQLALSIEDASARAERRVVGSVTEMQAKVRDAVGNLDRKPILGCFANGRPIQGQTIRLDESNNTVEISIRNSGNAKTSSIDMTLYLDIDSSLIVPLDAMEVSNDEPEFTRAFALAYNYDALSPGAKFERRIIFSTEENLPRRMKARIKVFSDIEPARFDFFLEFPRATKK